MNVEFLGLPGIGKSFLCSKLREGLEPEDGSENVWFSVPVDTQPRMKVIAQKLVFALVFTGSHPLVTWGLVNTIHSGGIKPLKSRVTKTVNLLFELYRNQRKGYQVYVSEQGVLQAVWSLSVRSEKPITDKILIKVKQWLPEVVVFVQADEKLHLERLAARCEGHSYYDRLTPEQLPQEVSDGIELLARIMNTCEQLTPASVRKFDVTNEFGSAEQGLGPVLEFITYRIRAK